MDADDFEERWADTGRRIDPHRETHWDHLERSGQGLPFARTYALEGIEIKRGGDGRVVEAYAAMFNDPYEVHDEHGDYMEVIHRSAFDRRLKSGQMPLVLWNHGMSLSGKPDALATVPLGTALEVRPDSHGLLTKARYNHTALADSVLEAIRAGDVKSQSFRGRIHASNPSRVPRVRPGESLPTVTRTELGLSDFGPTPVAVNSSARILAVRSSSAGSSTYVRMTELFDGPPKSMASLRRRMCITNLVNGIECNHPPRRPNW
jgi:HK97 family phage prohead protease